MSVLVGTLFSSGELAKFHIVFWREVLSFFLSMAEIFIPSQDVQGHTDISWTTSKMFYVSKMSQTALRRHNVALHWMPMEVHKTKASMKRTWDKQPSTIFKTIEFVWCLLQLPHPIPGMFCTPEHGTGYLSHKYYNMVLQYYCRLLMAPNQLKAAATLSLETLHCAAIFWFSSVTKSVDKYVTCWNVENSWWGGSLIDSMHWTRDNSL